MWKTHVETQWKPSRFMWFMLGKAWFQPHLYKRLQMFAAGYVISSYFDKGWPSGLVAAGIPHDKGRPVNWGTRFLPVTFRWLSNMLLANHKPGIIFHQLGDSDKFWMWLIIHKPNWCRSWPFLASRNQVAGLQEPQRRSEHHTWLLSRCPKPARPEWFVLSVRSVGYNPHPSFLSGRLAPTKISWK